MDFTGERLIPDQRRNDDLYYEHIVRYMFAAAVVAGQSVLDAGCGAGYGSALLADAGARSVVGMDVSPEAIDYARQHYRRNNLAFAVGDACALGLASASVGMVVAFEVIEHVQHPTLLVQESRRVLSDNGLFICSTPNLATYPAGNPYHKREMTRAEFEAVLAEHFPAVALFEEDYATAIVVRSGTGATAWSFTPAAERPPSEPDYFVAVCAGQQAVLEHAMVRARNIIYELPADRLGERIRDVLTLNALQAQHDRQLAEKAAQIAHLEEQLRRQGAWAHDLEQQLLYLRKRWYVRLFSRRWRRPSRAS